MESQRPDPNLGVQLQLEKALGHSRAVFVELLLSPLPWRDQDGAGDRFPQTPPTSCEGQTAHRLGRSRNAPQPNGPGVPKKSEWQNLGRTSPGLCP